MNAAREPVILHPKIKRYLEFLQEAFGIDQQVFARHRFFFRNERLVHIVADDHLSVPRALKSNVGLKFMHVHGTVPKLTTAAVLLFGRYATRNVVQLNEDQWQRFFAKKPVQLATAPDGEGPAAGLGRHVIVRYRGLSVGLGFVRDGELTSLSKY